MCTKTIQLVNDEEIVLRYLKNVLEANGYKTLLARDRSHAHDSISQEVPACTLLIWKSNTCVRAMMKGRHHEASR